MFPVMINVSGKECVIIGGGEIAYRKVLPLVSEGAIVTVISPGLCDDMKELLSRGKIKVLHKEAVKEDYYHAFLLVAATNSKILNEEILSNAQENQLVSSVSDHELGNFHIPASIHRGRLTIGISTSGASPHLAKKIKKDLLDRFDESYIEYTDFLWKARKKINQSELGHKEKSELLLRITDEEYRHSELNRKDFMELLVRK
ncbi:NAD(P)-dependent oxidoreductase [Bacillus sp. MUM 13]|uniref:NAD(P)-dependent oxidoreductase n=1 Tax=Bacillus sp. MUM 13 TaxID=1678001 RepID=UPI0008F5B6F5|nr:NAD(P)-dependent oxidoreductase [Bacillus sp. MUM 13]OIK08706.1 potassium transporter Trk [Bacillus sp. MUM 13]